MQNGFQVKGVTICEMEKRLEEKEKYIDRNGIKVYKQREFTDKILTNNGIRETAIKEEEEFNDVSTK